MINKLSISIIGISFFFSLNLLAVDKTGILEFGLKAGANIANISGDDAIIQDEDIGTIEPKTKIGITGGVFMTYFINDMFAIQPEILYSQKGCKYNFNAIQERNPVNIDIIFKYDYIDIPVLAKLIYPVQHIGNFNLHVGPSVGINVLSEANMKVTLLDSTNQSQDTTIKTEDAKSVVFNLVFGAGFGFDLDFGTISIEGRYNLALMNANNKAENATKEPDVKVNAISILASIAFK